MPSNLLSDIVDTVFSLDKKHFGFSELRQLLVPAKDEIKGYPCVVTQGAHSFAVKVIPLDNHYSLETHPALIELMVLKLLSMYPEETPHVVHHFKEFLAQNNKSSLTLFPLKRMRHDIHDDSLVLVTEFVKGESLDNLVGTAVAPNTSLSDLEWKVIIFGVLWSLAIFQERFLFLHNDCHSGNVLIALSETPSVGVDKYKWYAKKKCTTFTLPATKVSPKLWDFEFSQCYMDDLVPHNEFNDDHDHIPDDFNPHYDTHLFLTSLLELNIPSSVRDFVLSVFPVYLIPSKYLNVPSPAPAEDSIYSDDDRVSEISEADTFYSTNEELHSENDEDENDIEENDIEETDEDSESDISVDESKDPSLLDGGRLTNACYDNVKHLLPTPLHLLFKHPFFEEFRIEGGKDVRDTFRFQSDEGDPNRKTKPWTRF